MAHQNIIGNQMTEFMNSVCSIESKFDLIYNVANDILLDLNDGKISWWYFFLKNFFFLIFKFHFQKAKASIEEAASYSTPEETEKINEIKGKVCDEVFDECTKLKDILATLTDLTDDCKHFQKLEAQNRAAVFMILLIR